MEIDISQLPYKHRFAAASMLMSRGNRLMDSACEAPAASTNKNTQKILEAISFYDIALSILKRHDPNYQTLLNWKCGALISIGQFEDARNWYHELIRIARESEGHACLNATAKLAMDQIAILDGKSNTPLPEIDKSEIDVLDDPPFCEWAEQFCLLLRDGQFKNAHKCLSNELATRLPVAELKTNWISMLGSTEEDAQVNLETFKLGSQDDEDNLVGWCYFSISHGEANEAIRLEVFKTETNAFEIRSLEFGRP